MIGIAACGDRTPPTTPTPTAPTPPQATPPDSVDPGVAFRLDEGITSVGLDLQKPVVSYGMCRAMTAYRDIRYTIEVDLFDQDGNRYPVDGLGDEGTLAAGTFKVGCLRVGSDRALYRPPAVRYRARLTYWTTEGPEVTGTLSRENTIRPLVGTVPPKIIINEFRSRGPRGPTDQFVELYNDSVTPTPLEGLLFWPGEEGSRQRALSVTAPMIGPGCHLLLTAPGYSGSVPGDVQIPAWLTDDGFLAFVWNRSNLHADPDVVGMSRNFFEDFEGTPLLPFGSANTDRSYARIGPDSDDNARDFRMTSPSTPRNSGTCTPRPPLS